MKESAWLPTPVLKRPVCWRENSSSKRRWTDDEVIFVSEPTPAVVESVQTECADGGEVLEMYEGPRPLRYMTDNIGGGRQGIPQGSRSPDVHASFNNLGSLFHRVKVRIIAQSDSSTEDIQPSSETDAQILLPWTSMSQHCHSSQGLQANAGLRSGHLPENISLSEPTCSQGTVQQRLLPPSLTFSALGLNQSGVKLVAWALRNRQRLPPSIRAAPLDVHLR
ncbi:hypothetical protein MRX96_007977 [Rhipicephalus microplus]